MRTVSPAGMPPFEYSLPTRVLFGSGHLSRLPQLVEELAGPMARLFLVTGKRSLHASGVLERVTESLARYRVILFDQVPPSPAPDTAEAALESCRREGCTAVVAIGGGSALDIGKMTALLAPQTGPFRHYIEDQGAITGRGLPCIAIPTTSGSSSEVTPFAVVWDPVAKRKYPLVHPSLFPSVALVDPDLTLSMPSGLAAVTGMDAFTSAFEAYWSRQAHPLSDLLALEAIRLYTQNLERSCLQNDPQARIRCALACLYSGMAYSSARTSGCHAFATPLSLYFGVAHGAAVGVPLPAFLRWNAPTLGIKLSVLLAAMRCDTVEAAAQHLESLIERCGLCSRLGQLGVGPADVERLADQGLAEPQMRFNPRLMTLEEATTLLRELL